MIDPATIQRIKDAADIVDVVGDYVHLIKRGSNYMGLCPFHNERTPSFSVNAARNFCYCFSCKKGGSPINFIMEKEGLSYGEALRHLAKRYGIKVEERGLSDHEREAQSLREAMFVANEWAMNSMARNLNSTQEGSDIGLQYLYSRGVTAEAIEVFHLGYAIDSPDSLTTEAKKTGIETDVLKSVGLVGTTQRGQDYDRFRGRVIFPVMNTSGKVVAFGGRDLKGGIAKYINSPESEIYKKSNELYGAFQARPSIVKEDKCFLVEGYLDVIGMWQSGLRNVVASSGTALTDNQISLIRRFTSNVTLIYDGDAAGIKAALRGIDMLLSHNMDVKVLLLPDGHDPDSFSKEKSPEEFRDYISENETDIIKFKASLLADSINDDPQKRISAVNDMVETLACISDRIKVDVYVQECSQLLGVSEAAILKSVQDLRQRRISEKRMRDARTESNRLLADQQLVKDEQKGVSTKQDSAQEAHIPQSPRNNIVSTETYPFLPFEKGVIELCVKYGFLSVFSSADETGNTISTNILDFVKTELEADNLEFSVKIYGDIFNLLIDMKDDFRIRLDARKLDIEKEIQQQRSEMYKSLAERDADLNTIKREEKLIDQHLDNLFESMVYSFSREFPSRELASHEREDVRRVVTDLIQEKHQLSQIYMRDGSENDSNEHDLDMKVIRALTEWRNEILNQEVKSLIQAIAASSANNDEEGLKRLQERLSVVIQLRTHLAKAIGERIIQPPGKK